jgi:hypothetical protein
MIVVEKASSVLVGDGDDDRTQCLRKWGRLTVMPKGVEHKERLLYLLARANRPTL